MDGRGPSAFVNEQQPLLPSSPPPNLEKMILDGTISSKSLSVIKFLLSKEPYQSDQSLAQLLDSEKDITERLSDYFSRLMELRQYLPYEDTLKLGASKLSAPIPIQQSAYYLSIVDDDRNDIRAVMMAYLSLVVSSKISFFNQREGEKKSVRRYVLSELANSFQGWFRDDRRYDRLVTKLRAAARGECWTTPAEFYQAMMMSEEGIRWDDYLVSALQQFMEGFPNIVTEESEGCIATDKIKVILLGCRTTYHIINPESNKTNIWKRSRFAEYGPPECGFAIDVHLLFDQERDHYDIYYTKMIAPGMVHYLTQLDNFYYPPQQEMLALKSSPIYLNDLLINQFFDELGQSVPSEGIFSAIVSHFAKKPDAAVRTAFHDQIISTYNNRDAYTPHRFIQLLDEVCAKVLRQQNVEYSDKGDLMRAVFPHGDKAKETLRQILGAESLEDIIKRFPQSFAIQTPAKK